MYFDRLCASNYIVKRFCDVSARGRLFEDLAVFANLENIFGQIAG